MKTVISVKVDQEVKDKATMISKSMGLPLGTYLNMCLNDLVYRRTVRFSTPGYMTPYMEKTLSQTDKDIRAGRNLSPIFDNTEDAIAYLKSKD